MRPANAHGWLAKHADGCGGVHIEAASSTRERGGYLLPARRCRAFDVGALRRRTARGHGDRFRRATDGHSAGSCLSCMPARSGPSICRAKRLTAIHDAIRAIVARTGLAGLNSIDFLLDGDAFRVLEINARPSSTLTLYEAARHGRTACSPVISMPACTGALPHLRRQRRTRRARPARRVRAARLRPCRHLSATPAIATPRATTSRCPARASKPASRSARWS